MKCPLCLASVHLGAAVTRNCDACLRLYMELRADYKRRGRKLPRLAKWVLFRCRELGIPGDSIDA